MNMKSVCKDNQLWLAMNTQLYLQSYSELNFIKGKIYSADFMIVLVSEYLYTFLIFCSFKRELL